MKTQASGLFPAAGAEVQKKIFWVLVAVLGLIADIALPLWWALLATIPIFIVSWWIAYRSDWF